MAPPADHVAHLMDLWDTEKPDLDTEPIAVIARILRAARLLERELGRLLSGYGLSNREFDALGALRRSGPPYRLTPSELSHALLFSSGGLTALLERLANAGLVEREQDTNDRRIVHVALTERGKQLHEAAMLVDLDEERRLLSSLAPAARGALAEHLRELLVSLERTDTRWRLQPAVAAPKPPG